MMLTTKLNKIVLCATAQTLVAGLWHAGQLQHSKIFSNTVDGHRAFSTFLNAYPTTHVYLLANAVEEDYRLESLPHSTGSAKKELINRKLNQFYRGLEYRAAHFIMREKDKRKDDKFLFVALSNDDFLQHWVAAIQSVNARLVGVYLLPMLSHFLVRHYHLSSPHILLCEKLSSGLRQTYFHNGRLRMSRLIPNVPDDEKQLSYFYLVETQKTRLYLLSKRFISRDVTLNLQLVNLEGDVSSIQQNFIHETGIDCDIIQLAELAKSLNLNTASLAVMPELLHMQLLANGNLVNNLAPKSRTKHYRLSRASRWLKTFALIIAISSLLISTWYLVTGFSHQHTFKEAKQATHLQQLKYNDVAKSFPQTVVNVHDLKAAVTLDQQLSNLLKSPRNMMQAISRTLDQLPEITLTELHWMQGDQTTAPDSNVNTHQANKQLAEIGVITANITHFNGDYRSAIQLMHQFASQLRQDAAIAHVAVLQTPVNLNSYTDLHGNTNDAAMTGINQAASFKLKVTLKNDEIKR